MADGPMDRRKFFRRGLAKLLGEAIGMAEEAGTPLEKVLGIEANAAKPRQIALTMLQRPPGALKEVDYLSKCTRCGECVKACPAGAIVSDPATTGGAPYINSDSKPCVMCDSLACMSACPTGALVPVPRFEMDMGTAVWAEDLCLLSQDQACDACVASCPMGTAALEAVAGAGAGGTEIRVHPLSCTGCGICQSVCPTSPRAIRVIPKVARER